MIFAKPDRYCRTSTRELRSASVEVFVPFATAFAQERHCCPLVARNGPIGPVWRCPLIGVDRKRLVGGQNDAFGGHLVWWKCGEND
jgi:hypothetical protein